MSTFQWSDLVVALGLVFVIEGLVYTLFPGAARRMAMQIPQIADATLRTIGLAALCLGVFIVWMIRG